MKSQLYPAWIVFALVVCLFPAKTGRGQTSQPMELAGHSDAVYDVAFSPDGLRLASGSYDKTVKLWDASSGGELLTLRGHQDQVFRIAFSPDGKTLASCSGDGTTIIWDVMTGEKQQVLESHRDPMLDVDYSPDGHLIATAGAHIQLWRDGHELWSTPHSESFFAVAFSPDQKFLACGTRDLIRICEVADPDSSVHLVHINGMIYQVEYADNTKWLATASSNGSLSLWDVTTRELIESTTADVSALFTASFSSDSKYLVTGGRERVIRIWSVPDLKQVSERYGPEETVLTACFSPNGEWIAAGSYDGKIHLWSLNDEP